MTDRLLTVWRLLADSQPTLKSDTTKILGRLYVVQFIDQQCRPTNGVQFKREIRKNQPSWFTFSTRLGNWSFHKGIVRTDVYADANTKESLRKFTSLWSHRNSVHRHPWSFCSYNYNSWKQNADWSVLFQSLDCLCLALGVKARPNDRYISTQHIATLLSAALSRAFDHPLLRRVTTNCRTLGVIGSNLKMVKIFTQHLWMLNDVVFVWQQCCARGACNNVQQCCTRACALDQYPAATCCDRLGGQTGATSCTQQCYDMLCVQMLRSFGRGFTLNPFSHSRPQNLR